MVATAIRCCSKAGPSGRRVARSSTGLYSGHGEKLEVLSLIACIYQRIEPSNEEPDDRQLPRVVVARAAGLELVLSLQRHCTQRALQSFNQQIQDSGVV